MAIGKHITWEMRSLSDARQMVSILPMTGALGYSHGLIA